MIAISGKALLPFWAWISERHQIYLNRKAGKPWPWTADPIFQRYRFCEVFRELDKTTIWIRENWREPYADHPNLWLAMALARHINWPPTLQAIGFPRKWDPVKTLKIMLELRARGTQVFGGAYFLTADVGGSDTPTHTVWKKIDAIYQYAKTSRPPWNHTNCSLESAWAWFRGSGCFAWGPFMSYEVVTDMRWTRYLNQAPDIMTWANPGPGAFRGLNRLFGRPLKPNVKPEQALEEMRHLLALSRRHLPKHVPDLELREIEHSLCEYDKYTRVKNGEGRPRSLYVPPQLRLF